MLHPVQVRGCCCASPIQGEIFPLTTGNTTTAQNGLHEVVPPKSVTQIQAVQDCFGWLGMEPGYGITAGSWSHLPFYPTSTLTHPRTPSFLPHSPPPLILLLGDFGQSNSPLSRARGSTGKPKQRIGQASPPRMVVQTCFLVFLQHSWASSRIAFGFPLTVISLIMIDERQSIFKLKYLKQDRNKFEFSVNLVQFGLLSPFHILAAEFKIQNLVLNLFSPHFWKYNIWW